MTAGDINRLDENNEDNFLNSAESLGDLPDLQEDKAQVDEDYDFDGDDDDLDSIPSWIEDDGEEGSSGFNLQDGERLLQDDSGDANELQDASILFGSSESSDLKAAIEQRDSYIEALRHLQADFENYKKRVVRDQQEYAEMKNTKLIEELLPIVDNFNLALSSLQSDNDEISNLKKGVELVYTDLFSLLERQGLEKINSEGELFDPEIHDAVMHEDNGEHEHEIVVEVLRQGYKVRGRVIRPAMVKVAK